MDHKTLSTTEKTTRMDHCTGQADQSTDHSNEHPYWPFKGSWGGTSSPWTDQGFGCNPCCPRLHLLL